MIDLTLTGLPQTLTNIRRITSKLAKPVPGLEKATHKIAGVFEQNYDSEGGMVGGWAQLSEHTQAMREYQGYAPDHPILIRYGALRAVAIEFFQSARAGQTISQGDDYSDNVVAGQLRIIRGGKTATMRVGNSYKVLNQTGHDNARWGPNPARPFWFIDRNVVAAGQEGIREWVEDEVLAR